MDLCGLGNPGPRRITNTRRAIKALRRALRERLDADARDDLEFELDMRREQLNALIVDGEWY